MEPLVAILLAGSALLLVGALALSWRRRRSALRIIEEGTYEGAPPVEAGIHQIPLRRLADADAVDEEAYKVVERHRSRIWWSYRPKSLALDELGSLGLAVVRDVAGVYHPDAERPELRAGVRDLMILNLRVTNRLYRQLGRWPLRMLGDVRVDQALWVKEKVETFQESALGKIVKGSKIPYKVAKWAWRAYNVANPLYWSRQAIYTGGREAAVRYLLTSLVTYVGEEAVLTYSGRGPAFWGEAEREEGADDHPAEEDLADPLEDMPPEPPDL